MSRSQIRFLLGLTILALIATLGYLSSQVGKQRDTARLIDELAAESSGEDTVQRMTEFRRVKMQDGKKVWEIVARQARYFPDKNEIIIETPQVSLYLGDGEAVALRCQEGIIHLDGNSQDLRRIELRGDVEITMGDITFTTEEAIYDRHKNTISSSGLIHIVGRGFTVEGRGYTVAIDTKQLLLQAEVQTTVTQEAG